MSIIAYVGRMGSGKSYGVVENVILPALKNGRTIVTNIPLKTGYLTDDFPDGRIIQFNPKEPLEDPEFFNIEKWAGAIIIIDEAWRYWSTGTKASQIPEIQKSFFTEHRHYVGEDGLTCEIVLVTQSLDQISSFVRELVEDTYRATKLSTLGLSKAYRVDVFTGCQKGLSGGTPIRTLQGTYKPDVFKYYQSHTKNKTDFAAGMEEKADKRNNIFKSKLFVIGIPLAIIVTIASISSLTSYFTPPEAKKPEDVQQPTGTPEKLNKIKINKDLKKQRQLQEYIARFKEREISEEFLPISDKYRIVGKINNEFLIHSDTGTRTFNKLLCSRFTTTKEEYCVYNQELITWYSSRIPVDKSDRKYLDTSIDEIF